MRPALHDQVGRNLGERISRERSRTPLNRAEQKRPTWPFAKGPGQENDRTPFTPRRSPVRSQYGSPGRWVQRTRGGPRSPGHGEALSKGDADSVLARGDRLEIMPNACLNRCWWWRSPRLWRFRRRSVNRQLRLSEWSLDLPPPEDGSGTWWGHGGIADPSSSSGKLAGADHQS